MERFVKGDIVVIPFPFSDLSSSKKRPAFVLADLEGDDLILCQITSRSRNDNYSVELLDKDFSYGTLSQPSNIRPNRIFTADSSLILRKIGHVSMEKKQEVVNKVIEIIKIEQQY